MRILVDPLVYQGLRSAPRRYAVPDQLIRRASKAQDEKVHCIHHRRWAREEMGAGRGGAPLCHLMYPSFVTVPQLVAALVNSLAWPAGVVAVAILLRRELVELLHRLQS